MNSRINKYKYPGAKRLMLEAQELKDKTEDYCAQPIDDNLFEWHFTVRGPPETAFEGGFYHGRLSFPTEYPMKPPSIILLTPNGRFETDKKICLSISGYHPETWQPSWSVRTALLALIAFMPTKTNRAIGSLDYSDAERKKLARNSRTYCCETCGPIKHLLKHPGEQTSNNNDCEANSTKRVDEQLERRSLSSDSDGENRDSSIDSQKSSTNTNGSDSECASSTLEKEDELLEQESISNNDAITENNSTNLENDPSEGRRLLENESSNASLGTNPINETPNHERGRSFQPLILISISILLFLLILRRVLMIIQA